MKFRPDVLAERLRSTRQFMGLTQAELGRMAKLQPCAVSHFEIGTRRPSVGNLCRLAGALDVSTDYLLGLRDEA